MNTMLSKVETRQLIDGIFEQEALVLGGLVAVREIEDDLVWRLIRSFDRIRERTLYILEGQASGLPGRTEDDGPDLAPHPAVEEFLLKLRRAERDA
jgi:hypothetical protein